MKNEKKSTQAAERMLPLLRVIGREVRERTRAIGELEARISDLALSPALHAADLSYAESELSMHRRELRGIEKEMARLGCSFDQDDPTRIVVPGTAISLACDRTLGDTKFFRVGGVA